jgi:hypothetical protein
MKNINLQYLYVGINLALAVHFGVLGDVSWVLFSLAMVGVNIATIYLVAKEEE